MCRTSCVRSAPSGTPACGMSRNVLTTTRRMARVGAAGKRWARAAGLHRAFLPGNSYRLPHRGERMRRRLLVAAATEIRAATQRSRARGHAGQREGHDETRPLCGGSCSCGAGGSRGGRGQERAGRLTPDNLDQAGGRPEQLDPDGRIGVQRFFRGRDPCASECAEHLGDPLRASLGSGASTNVGEDHVIYARGGGRSLWSRLPRSRTPRPSTGSYFRAERGAGSTLEPDRPEDVVVNVLVVGRVRAFIIARDVSRPPVDGNRLVLCPPWSSAA